MPDFQKPHAQELMFSHSQLAALKIYKYPPPLPLLLLLITTSLLSTFLKRAVKQSHVLASPSLAITSYHKTCYDVANDSSFSKVKEAAVKRAPTIRSRGSHVDLFSKNDDHVFMWVSKVRDCNGMISISLSFSKIAYFEDMCVFRNPVLNHFMISLFQKSRAFPTHARPKSCSAVFMAPGCSSALISTSEAHVRSVYKRISFAARI
jgi:hypothetical protein